MEKISITIETQVDVSVKKVWDFWTKPEHITKWNAASDDWHTPFAENDVRVDGKFKSTMAAKDGSMSFDFEGVYTNVMPLEIIEYAMLDGRKVLISFIDLGSSTQIIETFEAESSNPIEMQKTGWQSILNNFKTYAEAQ